MYHKSADPESVILIKLGYKNVIRLPYKNTSILVFKTKT